MINQLGEQASEEELGGKLASALAHQLRITRAQASRRVGEADDLGQRRALSGQPLAPQLTATAAAQRDGQIGEAQVRVIRDFFITCPSRSTAQPARKPKPIWPGWPPSLAPTNWPNWRSD